MEFGFRAYGISCRRNTSARSWPTPRLWTRRCAPASTFWVACEDMAQPRCALEALAAAVFRTHTSSVGADAFDEGRAARDGGADREKVSRSALGQRRSVPETSGIFVHPATSTVTYLTGNRETTRTRRDAGVRQPDRRKSPGTARASLGTSGPTGVPPRLSRVGQRRGSTSRSTEASARVFPELTPGEATGDPASGSRVTFLVNIWLNHRPRDVRRLPDDVARALTPNAEIERLRLGVASRRFRHDRRVVDDSSPKTLREPLRDRFFGWSGDEMRLDGALPLALMREEGGRGVGGVAEVDLDETSRPQKKASRGDAGRGERRPRRRRSDSRREGRERREGTKRT